MSMISAVNASELMWETVTEGVERCLLRSLPGEKRTLIRIGAGRAFPVHAHAVPDEVFVVDGVYVDPQVEDGKPFESGTYLYYPVGTEHQATSPSGCTILVWNANP
jgi:anti-sigma factor ChrR (cupin superfamily)